MGGDVFQVIQGARVLAAWRGQRVVGFAGRRASCANSCAQTSSC